MFKCSLRFEEINLKKKKKKETSTTLRALVFNFSCSFLIFKVNCVLFSLCLSLSHTYLSVFVCLCHSVPCSLCLSFSFCVCLCISYLYSPSYPYFIESVVLWFEPRVLFVLGNHFPTELNPQSSFFFLVWFHLVF